MGLMVWPIASTLRTQRVMNLAAKADSVALLLSSRLTLTLPILERELFPILKDRLHRIGDEDGEEKRVRTLRTKKGFPYKSTISTPSPVVPLVIFFYDGD